MTEPLRCVAVLLVFLAAALNGAAATRSSANYSFLAETTDGGGGPAQSASYALASSVGPLGTGTAQSSAYQAQNSYVGQAAAFAGIVDGRLVFYNHSTWDGNDVLANANDDNAIAPEKSALLPGGTATFANYTSYSRGLNGLMIDLAVNAVPSQNDFVFKVGNDSTPNGWGPAPPPSSISVRYGAGVGGADRVTLIWPDNAIEKRWLQVTVQATATTGLAANDVFYFGNAIGDSGNAAANAIVNVTDVALTRANPRSPLNPAPISFSYDYNRDGLVNVTDIAIARANQTSPLTALQLISLASPALANALPQAARAAVLLAATDFQLDPSPLGASGGSPRMAKSPPNRLGPLSISLSERETLLLSFESDSDESFHLQLSRELHTAAWNDINLTPDISPDGRTFRWEVPLRDTQPQGFYRIVPAPIPPLPTGYPK